MARLTDKQWDELIAFYDEGHTMPECAKLWGVSPGTISQKFKRIGKKARPRFIPSREEKYDKLKNREYIEQLVSSNNSPPESDGDPAPQEGGYSPRKRKIISLAGNGGEGKMLYEKEVC